MLRSRRPRAIAQRVDAEALARAAEQRGWIAEAERHQRLIARLDTLIDEAQAGWPTPAPSTASNELVERDRVKIVVAARVPVRPRRCSRAGGGTQPALLTRVGPSAGKMVDVGVVADVEAPTFQRARYFSNTPPNGPNTPGPNCSGPVLSAATSHVTRSRRGCEVVLVALPSTASIRVEGGWDARDTTYFGHCFLPGAGVPRRRTAHECGDAGTTVGTSVDTSVAGGRCAFIVRSVGSLRRRRRFHADSVRHHICGWMSVQAGQ
jgi:hypothetical protein